MDNTEFSIFPENTVTYGKFWPRVGAYLLDFIILCIPTSIIGSITGSDKLSYQLQESLPIPPMAWVGLFLNVIVSWLYFALFESSEKQTTIGKMALKLVVTDMAGNRISFSRATGRYFGMIVSTIILFIGFIMTAWDPRGQTLHDKMAGTLVVKRD